MNFQQYEVFKAIMDTGSITAAGDLLNLSQPSISKYKILLEKRLDLKLFERRGNRLHPTAEGLALYEQVQRIYTGIDHLENYAESLKYNQDTKLSIAAIPLIAYRWLPREIAICLKNNQDVSLSLSLRTTEWIQKAVASRKIDFGIVQGKFTDPNLEAIPLMQLPMVCVCKSDHRLASYSEVTVNDLMHELVITLYEYDKGEPAMVRVFEAIKHMHRLDVTSSHLACELVSQGLGIKITDALAASDFQTSDLVMRPFHPSASSQISLLQVKDQHQMGITNSVITALVESARRQQKMLSRYIAREDQKAQI